MSKTLEPHYIATISHAVSSGRHALEFFLNIVQVEIAREISWSPVRLRRHKWFEVPWDKNYFRIENGKSKMSFKK
jgi:hypothetical protein